MNIQIVPASLEMKDTIQNMARFYAYDMSEYMGKLAPGWEFPEHGLYEAHDLSKYWDEPNRYAFLVRVNEHLAGFILIHKIGSTPILIGIWGSFSLLEPIRARVLVNM